MLGRDAKGLELALIGSVALALEAEYSHCCRRENLHLRRGEKHSFCSATSKPSPVYALNTNAAKPVRDNSTVLSVAQLLSLDLVEVGINSLHRRHLVRRNGEKTVAFTALTKRFWPTERGAD